MTTTQTDAMTSDAPSPYKDEWEGGDWSSVQNDFKMTEAKPDEVILAAYGRDGYDGYANVLYRNGNAYFYASGSHCSCYGLEEQWSPEEYTLETLVAALERSGGERYGFCGSDGPGLLPALRQRLKRRQARDRRAKAVS